MCRPTEFPPYDEPSLEDATPLELLELDAEAFAIEELHNATRDYEDEHPGSVAG